MHRLPVGGEGKIPLKRSRRDADDMVGSMTMMGSQAAAAPHYFTAAPVVGGFEVRDDVVPGRVYQVPANGTPMHRGRVITNPVTLARIGAAVDECVEQALLDEIAREAA